MNDATATVVLVTLILLALVSAIALAARLLGDWSRERAARRHWRVLPARWRPPPPPDPDAGR